MRRRATLILLGTVVLVTIFAALRTVSDSSINSTTAKDNACDIRIAAQGLAIPIQSHSVATSEGTSQRHVPELAGEFARVKWTDSVRGLHIDHEQLVLLRECSLTIHLRATTSAATVAVPRPISERWFRVSLKEPASGLDRLSGWRYGEDSKKFNPFDVPASQTDWQNIVFPERATIGLFYRSVDLSISRNLTANYAGMDVDVSIERVEGAATQRQSDSPPSK